MARSMKRCDSLPHSVTTMVPIFAPPCILHLSYQSHRLAIRACKWSGRKNRSTSTLQPNPVTPAPRSVPAPRPPAPRSAPLHRFSATPAHRSAPLHPIFGSLRSALRSDSKARFTRIQDLIARRRLIMSFNVLRWGQCPVQSSIGQIGKVDHSSKMHF